MASYPTAIYAPAAKNTGDVVQASHVNNLDNEVVAVETGLKNGLGHALTISTGGLTVSTGATILGGTLSVAGGSTFASAVVLSSGLTVSTGNTILGQNLSVAGGSTLVGSVVCSSLVTAAAQPRALVYSSAAVTLAVGAFTALSFESEEFDVGGMHSTASNPSRLTVPAGAGGLYMMGASVRISTGGAPNQVDMRFVKNSTTEITGSVALDRSTSATVSLVMSSPVTLSAGDYVEVEVVASASTGSIAAATLRRGMQDFWLMKVW